MHAIRRSLAFAALTLLLTGGCELRCNGPVVVIPTKIKYGGRAVAIATHPADDASAFVVSESGGIFRTSNFGSPWFHVSRQSTFWFSDIHYFDANPNIIIATAFEDLRTDNGGGVWRSTNGGDSWQHIAITPPDTSRPFEAYCIAVEPSEPARIWVGTSSGLAYSDDQGVTWAFIPWAGNFRQVPVWSVLAPQPGHLRVLTRHGFRSSDDRGATWLQAIEGPLPGPFRATHNQLACSPASDSVLYWCGDYTTGIYGGDSTILIRSMDRGRRWTKVKLLRGHNRDAFIRVTPRALSGVGKYQIYFGDGSAFLGRAEVGKSDEKIGAWQTLAVEHVDASDIGFKADGFTPWLLAGDGGLQTTTDKGAHWKMAGNGADGYAALQISDATGQAHTGDREADLYFGTQDNSFWASADNGRTWPYSALTEGVHINVGERAASGDHNRVNFVLLTSGGGADMISGPLLSSPTEMNVPQGDGWGARRLGDRTFMRPVRPAPGANPIWVTKNNGAFWITQCDATGFVEPSDRVKAVDVAGQPIVFFAVSRGMNEKVIMRAVDLISGGTPLLSTVTGFGRLGFAQANAPSSDNPLVWEALYAVDPFDPGHILVVDDRDSTIKVTHDGGASWTVDQALVSRITNRGMYKFRRPRFPLLPMNQVTVISFDPHTRGRILVGTIQSGVIFSCDFGQTWHRLEDSENIPNVSSFYFTAEGWVLASSYGRGLWRLRIKCPPSDDLPPFMARTTSGPFLYSSGALIPIGTLEPEPKVSFVVVRGGSISGIRTDTTGTQVERIELKSGSAEGLSVAGERTAVAVPVVLSTALPRAEKDAGLASLLKEGFQIKGALLEGRQFRGYVLGKNDIGASDLAPPRVPGPAIAVSVSADELRRVATITGVRFRPSGTLQVLVNGEILDITRTADRDGQFRFTIPVPPRPGHYELTVKQAGAPRPIEAWAPYEIVNAD